MSDRHAAELIDVAERLAEIREDAILHPSRDGKLAEAEINLRGVAGLLEDRADV